MVALRWHPRIGDPTPVGWFTVFAYGFTALVCARVVLTARAGQRGFSGVDDVQARDRRSLKYLWLVMGLTMLLLGINKQLDLQTLVIQRVRRRAYVDGWYGDRRRYQKDFIVAMTVTAAIVVTLLSVWLRRVLRRVLLAIAGLGLLVLFVLVRASSFHYVDRLLSLGGRVRMNWIIELGGIGLIVVAALHNQATGRRELDELSTVRPAAAEMGLPSRV